MKRKFKPTFDELEPRRISFSITVADYLQFAKAAATLNLTVADVMRIKLGLPTAKELKKKRLERNRTFFINN